MHVTMLAVPKPCLQKFMCRLNSFRWMESVEPHLEGW